MWHKLECAKRIVSTNVKKRIEEQVEAELANGKNLKIEVKDASGDWVELGEE